MDSVNRRCKECDPTTDWVDGIKFCPKHGEPVRDFEKPACVCGEPITGFESWRRYCGNCGEPIIQLEPTDG